MTHGGSEPLPRYRLVVAYDGGAYHGFQLQGPHLDTVAGRLEDALARICPEGQEGGRVTVEGASRTDAGVHALGQVCAFSSRLTVPLDRLPVAVNSHLPADISVLSAERVPPEFEPRRQARAKTYAYHMWRSQVPSPFWRDRALHVVQELDLEACRAALAPLEGRHDFAAFRDMGSSAKTTVRTITRAELVSSPLPSGWPRPGEFITLRLTGDGFLYHMVRIILGTLLDVGWGRLPPLITRQALASGKRAALGQTAPAHGLWLERVVYGDGDGDTAGSAPGPEDLERRGFGGFHFP